MKTAACLFFACVMMAISCSSPINALRDRCGADPGTLRFLSADGPLNTSASECLLCLRRIAIERGRTILNIAIRDSGQFSTRDYYSVDGGVSWTPGILSTVYNTNITTTQTRDLGYISSRVDPAIVYFNHGIAHGAEFKRSMDGGITFSVVKPIVASKDYAAIDDFDIISTGGVDRRRVYARVYSGKKKAVCISDDYGDHFNFIAYDATFIHESGSDSKMLISFGDSGLMRSTNGGNSWKALEGAKELFRPIYKNRADGMLRSRMIDLTDEIFIPMEAVWYGPSWLVQIENDPKDADIIYVLCIKGLYRSIDGGNSFRLLSLAAGEIRGIAKIGIDPLNGNNIYAVVGTSILSKSTDMGCTWKTVATPID
jgi:hypothetical protein